MYKDIFIVSAVRTPFGRYGGSLRGFDYFDLGAICGGLAQADACIFKVLSKV